MRLPTRRITGPASLAWTALLLAACQPDAASGALRPDAASPGQEVPVDPDGGGAPSPGDGASDGQADAGSTDDGADAGQPNDDGSDDPDAGSDPHPVDDGGTSDAAPPRPDRDGDGVHDEDDCAPDAPQAWQLLGYAFRDADGDGRGVEAPLEARVCSGEALPSGYALATGDLDCDDAAADLGPWLQGYLDADDDGYGEETPTRLCTDGRLPEGYAAQAGDCAPTDPTGYRLLSYAHRDADGDGRTVPAAPLAQVCTSGTLPIGYLLDPGERDCDDARADRFRLVQLFVDADGDRVGAGAAEPVCSGQDLLPGYAEAGGDCAPDDPARHQLLAYDQRDADGDGLTVSAPAGAQVCAGAELPIGYLNGGLGASDCDDQSAALGPWLDAFLDADHDGLGDGEAVRVCTDGQLSAGYASRAGDCAPDDGTRLRLLAYQYRDADGDGRTVAAPPDSFVCSGHDLPDGHFTAAHDADCDDRRDDVWRLADAFFDRDRDGIGAGERTTLCIGAALPVGYAREDGDCAPDEPQASRLLPYGFRDADGDGRTVAAAPGASVCAGPALPAGYENVARESDCDDTRPSAWLWIVAYPDADRDGTGTSEATPLCSDGTVPAGYADHDGDCAPLDPLRSQQLGYAYRDADRDLRTVPSAGTVCSGGTLPPGYLNTQAGEDCDDADASVWAPQPYYVDADEDGFGTEPLVALCQSASPVGYAPDLGDCAPDDAQSFRMLAYSYRDADLDGRTRSESGSVCAGTWLPDGYETSAWDVDCDDTDAERYRDVALYEDEDRDGFGAGSGIITCIGELVPDGLVFGAGDCAPLDASRYTMTAYRYVDRDGDGATVSELGSTCGNGRLRPPYFANPRGLDCDDTSVTRDHYGAAYRDLDRDTFGTGRAYALCLGAEYPDGHAQFGTDMDDAAPDVTEPRPDVLDLY